jgi:nucleotide sugar dehydrogenase
MATVATLKESIDVIVRRMALESKDITYPGIAIVLDKQNTLLGIVTDGDIRRAYADDIPFSNKISEIMIDKPITISEAIPKKDIELEVVRKVQLNKGHNSEWVRHVLVVNDKNQLTNIIDYLDILQSRSNLVNRVVVFGMGYVGITLAVSLANRGHQVIGIDIENTVVNLLNQGKSHVLEVGLPDMLIANLKRNSINFSTTLDTSESQVYIVAVGTPLNSDSKPDMSALFNVLEEISKVLKRGDQVILRSTVPVGVTREFVIPKLEKGTRLKAGKDFYVSFAPERTIEGDAMHELKTLPQIVGGYSSKCTKNSVEFWSTLTPTVVRVDTLEAAELVKLANNTFRDVSFSFANELALLADKYNVNSFDLINAANEGYLRNKIPLPSPGVGGYCLTKDPILFSCTANGPRSDAVLGISSRKVNERALDYPVKLINRYANRMGLLLSSLNVLIIGIAFKGVPETADTRGSVAIDIFHKINNLVRNVYAWDAVISSEKLKKIGFKEFGILKEVVQSVDIVLILNNHPDNILSDLYETPKNSRFLFDGWNQIDRLEIEKVSGLDYATMGYMTP